MIYHRGSHLRYMYCRSALSRSQGCCRAAEGQVTVLIQGTRTAGSRCAAPRGAAASCESKRACGVAWTVGHHVHCACELSKLLAIVAAVLNARSLRQCCGEKTKHRPHAQRTCPLQERQHLVPGQRVGLQPPCGTAAQVHDSLSQRPQAQLQVYHSG